MISVAQPTPWNVSPPETGLHLAALWRSCFLALPIWEGGGTRIHNYSPCATQGITHDMLWDQSTQFRGVGDNLRSNGDTSSGEIITIPATNVRRINPYQGTLVALLLRDDAASMMSLYFSDGTGSTYNGYGSGSGDLIEVHLGADATDGLGFFFQWGTGSTQLQAASTSPATDEWHTLIGTWHWQNGVAAFANGVLLQRDATSFTPDATKSVTNCWIGRPGDSTSIRRWDGFHACVLAFDRELTALEIALLSKYPYILFEYEPFFPTGIGAAAVGGVPVLRRRIEGY
jgi:hypothetical protein